MNGLLWSTSQAPHIDGIYYDGINFDRRSMQRVRKVLNAGARGAAPLVDIHTGDNGPKAPAATRYLSHFAYADSAWNGEGFDWSRGPIYWLVAASGFIHGIAADRLGGGGVDFKALAFAMYTRNLDTAPPIWSFWRDVDIGAPDVAMRGWWSDAPPLRLGLPPPASAAASPCSTDPASAADADGASTAVLATSHVAKGRLAVVVVASWCAVDANVTLRAIDWEALGLDPAKARVEQPAIAKLQAAQPAFPAADASSHPLPISAGQGVVLVVR